MSTPSKPAADFRYITTHERLHLGQLPLDFAPISTTTRAYLGIEKTNPAPGGPQILNAYCFDMSRPAKTYDEGGFSFDEIGGTRIGFFVGFLHFMRGDAMDWPSGRGLDRPWLGKSDLSLYSRGLFVHPDYRGMGIAQKMIDAIVRTFPDGRFVARLTEKELVGSFKRAGFGDPADYSTPDGTKIIVMERGRVPY